MKHCRSLLILLGLTCLVFTAPLRADEKSYGYARIVRLSLVHGDVQIARSSSSDWENAIPNMPIQQGFTLGTNNGRAEVEFESGAAMWIAENSVVQFTELALSDGGRVTRLTVSQGAASFDVNLKSGDVFEVGAPSFRVTVPKQAIFRVDAFRDGASVSVSRGLASVNEGPNMVAVASGKTIAIRGGAAGQSSLTANPRKDSWDSWVNERAGILSLGANQTTQYTNAPFSYGMSDLSSYGNWSNCGGSGYGWQPWGTGAGWAPFYDGYFNYYGGIGWTWISFEPWGWAPYHFGNWAYNAGCGGWSWFPGGYGFWNAAPVSFVGTGGGKIGWRPNPVPWPNPRGLNEPLAKSVSGSEHGKFLNTPIVIGAKGGIGNGFPTGILAPGKGDEVLAAMSEPPGKNGKFVANENSERSSIKPPLAVPTAPSLAELRKSIAFDPEDHRFVNGEGAAGASGKLPVLANGVREPHGVPRPPEPSGFVFSPESMSRVTAEGRSGFSMAASQGGGFSHGAEAGHASGSEGSADAHGGGGSAPAASSGSKAH